MTEPDPTNTPVRLLDTLVSARSSGDVAAALACYEPGAAIVVQPGVLASGTDAVRGVLEFFAASRATFAVSSRSVLEADGVALHLSAWTLRGTDPSGVLLDLVGRSADVARRQPDGGWLLAVDNPWGSDSALPSD